MGFFLFAIALGIASEILWFMFYRSGKKNFKKYDQEHSKVSVANMEEIVSRLNKNLSLGISDIVSESNQVDFVCKKNRYTIYIENNIAYVDYDVAGCEARVSTVGKIMKRFRFWKSAHKAILINRVMDTIQNNTETESQEYKKIKIFARSAVLTFFSFLVFLIIGFFSILGGEFDKSISEVQSLEYCEGVTYQELFEAYIKDAEWTSFIGENTIAVVEVTGMSVEGERICIQFCGETGAGLSYRNLNLRYFEADGISLDPDEALEYVYLYYYLNE